MLKVLGETFVMVLLCHSSECGCFQVPGLFCLPRALALLHLFGCNTKRGKARTIKQCLCAYHCP